MLQIARQYYREKGIEYDPIYLNGGSGLFLLMTDEKTANEFGRRVQKKYHEATQGGASVTYIVLELPENLPDSKEVLKTMDLRMEFEIVRYLLREAKGNPH